MTAILETPILLLDGGLGTTLADHYDCTFDETAPLWSSQLLLTDPAKLSDCQSAFAGAGADIILSATYQASYEGFRLSGVGEEEAGVSMRSAVKISSDAFEAKSDGTLVVADEGKQKKGMVALSLGAYGATMIPGQEYSGLYDPVHSDLDSLRAWHLTRLKAFFPSSSPSSSDAEDLEKRQCWDLVDLVAFETLPRVDEILAVRSVMSLLPQTSTVPTKPFWIACVFPGEKNCLPDGTVVSEIATAMLGQKHGGGAKVPMGVGINCTKVGKIESLVEEFENAIRDMIQGGEVGEWPSLVVYPDGTNGEVYNTTTKEWEKKEGAHDSSVSAPIFGS